MSGYCCNWMKKHVEKSPGTGFRLVATDVFGDCQLMLRFESMWEHERLLSQCAASLPNVCVGASDVVFYCPNCGANWQDWMQENRDLFARLYKREKESDNLDCVFETRRPAPAMDRRYCCRWTEAWLELADKKGMALIPRRRRGRDVLVKRFLWVDPVKWNEICPGRKQRELTELQTEFEPRYCLGCGKKLDVWIKEQPELFEEHLRRVVDA